MTGPMGRACRATGLCGCRAGRRTSPGTSQLLGVFRGIEAHPAHEGPRLLLPAGLPVVKEPLVRDLADLNAVAVAADRPGSRTPGGRSRGGPGPARPRRSLGPPRRSSPPRTPGASGPGRTRGGRVAPSLRRAPTNLRAIEPRWPGPPAPTAGRRRRSNSRSDGVSCSAGTGSRSSGGGPTRDRCSGVSSERASQSAGAWAGTLMTTPVPTSGSTSSLANTGTLRPTMGTVAARPSTSATGTSWPIRPPCWPTSCSAARRLTRKSSSPWCQTTREPVGGTQRLVTP